jgi:hypothetical protein
MSNYQLLSEAFGLLSVFFYLVSSGTTNDRKMNALSAVGSIVLGVHLGMAEQYLASAGLGIAATRNICSLYYDKAFVKFFFMLVFFALLGYATVNFINWYDVLTPLAGVVVSYAVLYTAKNQRTFWLFFATVLWFIYGWAISSFSIITLESLITASLLFRFLKQNSLLPKYELLKLNRRKNKL